jgi:hypothetical protein
MIDLTGDSDVDIPDVDHTATLRANILRSFFDQSRSRSPVKPTSPSTSKSPQPPSFLDMIRARRGFSVAKNPAEDTGVVEDEVGRMEEDVSSNRTHESSTADPEVDSSFCFHPPTTQSSI